MAIATLNERTSKLAAAKAKTAELETEMLDMADAALREAVAARRATSTEARLTRISVVAHIERALYLGRRGRKDLESMEGRLREEGHRFPAVRDAIHQAEKAIEGESWRISPPGDPDGLLAALAKQYDADKIRHELNEYGWNCFMILGLAYLRVGARAPHLFGKLSVEDEQAQVDAADGLVNDTLAWLRENPQIASRLYERYAVEIRPGADGVKDLFDAALAKASGA